MKASDLRNAFEAGRPLVEAWLNIAEQMAALRDHCRTKEIDWQQLKTLLKAQIQDAEKGETKRVDAILEKADNATAYADLLGIKPSEKNISRDAPQQVSIAPAPAPVAPAQPSAAPEPIAPYDFPDLPAHLDRRVSQ